VDEAPRPSTGVQVKLLIPQGHRDADAILDGRFSGLWGELRDTLTDISPPLRASEPFTTGRRPDVPKRHKVRADPPTYRMLPIDQSALNLEIDRRLRALGWTSQPYALEAVTGGHLPTYLQGDFAKQSVFVEVEFGNQASLFRDLFKFQIAGQTQAGDVGILVVATDRMARFFDSGVATYGQALRLMPYMRIGLSLPTAIVGLDLSDDDWSLVGARYREMQSVAEANGVICRSFEDAWRAPTSDPDLGLSV
jgi:hypothetical protein